ncbi:MAG: hypothetical protein WEC39_00560 [Patescibacteria group bacterium]
MRRTLPRQKTHKRDATPGLIYLVGILAYGAWGGWFYLLLTRSPEDLKNRLLFLGSFFLAILFTGVFLFYQVSHATTGKTPRVIFYPAARRGLFLAVFFLSLGAMKIFTILNPLNAFLLGAILLLIEFQASRRTS